MSLGSIGNFAARPASDPRIGDLVQNSKILVEELASVVGAIKSAAGQLRRVAVHLARELANTAAT
jgi:hypothetical protein